MTHKHKRYAIIVLALILSLSIIVLSSCNVIEPNLYTDKPLPEYDYPTKIRAINYVSAVLMCTNDNEQDIRAFIDMLNSCEYKKTTITIDDPAFGLAYTYFFVVDNEKVMGETMNNWDFAIFDEGNYLWLPEDYEPIGNTDILTVYEIKGFDMSIAKPLLKGLYFG